MTPRAPTLTRGEVAHFIAHGFVRLEGCVSAAGTSTTPAPRLGSTESPTVWSACCCCPISSPTAAPPGSRSTPRWLSNPNFALLAPLDPLHREAAKRSPVEEAIARALGPKHSR